MSVLLQQSQHDSVDVAVAQPRIVTDLVERGEEGVASSDVLHWRHVADNVGQLVETDTALEGSVSIGLATQVGWQLPPKGGRVTGQHADQIRMDPLLPVADSPSAS